MHKSSHRKKKRLRLTLVFLLCISVILGIYSFYVAKQIKPFVENQLDIVLNKATNNLYNIKFEKVYINPIRGSATLTKVEIVPNQKVYQQLVKAQKAPNNLYHIQLNALSVKQFHLLKFYFEKELLINLLLFDSPKITMINKSLSFNENKSAQPEKSPYEIIKNMFNSFRVKDIEFKNTSLKFVDNNADEQQVDTISNLNIKLKDWLIDENSASDTTRFFLLKDAQIQLSNYVYATPDSMYYISAKDFEFSAKAKQAHFNVFELIPRYSELDFAKVNGYARDRYNLQLNRITLNGIDLIAYLRKQVVRADSMYITDGQLAVFNDRTYPKRNEDKTGRFPVQLLQKLKIPISIDKIDLQNLNISYAEFSPISKQRGYINFVNTSGIIQNVTNEESRKIKNPILKMQLQSYLMKQGKLDVAIDFNLTSTKAEFTYKGELHAMDASQLNYITRPLALVHIKNCDIKSLKFDFKANENETNGVIDFNYQKLAVGLLKIDENTQNMERKGLLSLLTNTSLINTNNPSSDGNHIVATVTYKRNKTGSFFHYLWRSIFKGVKHTIGFSDEREAKIKEYLRNLKDIKQDREYRKRRREV